MRVQRGVTSRLLHVDGSPVLVRAWEPGKDRVSLRAEALDPGAIAAPGPAMAAPGRRAGAAELELALERMRFALAVDDDLGEFYRRFKGDPLLGPLLRRRPYLRPRRRPWPWEALAWAVVKQLIETGRAARIQRRMVGRWGLRLGPRGEGLRDVPTADLIAGRAPVELESMGLALQARDRPARDRRPGRRRSLRARPAGGRPAPAARCARSVPGPCSASASSAAATPTRCRPAT